MKAMLVKTGKYRAEINVECNYLADNFEAAVQKLFDVDFKMWCMNKEMNRQI